MGHNGCHAERRAGAGAGVVTRGGGCDSARGTLGGVGANAAASTRHGTLQLLARKEALQLERGGRAHASKQVQTAVKTPRCHAPLQCHHWRHAISGVLSSQADPHTRTLVFTWGSVACRRWKARCRLGTSGSLGRAVGVPSPPSPATASPASITARAASSSATGSAGAGATRATAEWGRTRGAARGAVAEEGGAGGWEGTATAAAAAGEPTAAAVNSSSPRVV